MSLLRRFAPLAALLALTLVVSACGDDEPAATTEALTFGEGVIPESVPDDFPIPVGAEIGNTLVDKLNNNTEFALTIRSDPTSAVQFFQVGLVNQGYVVESSDGNQTIWEITFSRGQALTGSIVLTAPADDLVAAVVSLSTS
jgi:hypothetical protein